MMRNPKTARSYWPKSMRNSKKGRKWIPTKLDGIIGRTFSTYQDKYTAQVKWNLERPYKDGDKLFAILMHCLGKLTLVVLLFIVTAAASSGSGPAPVKTLQLDGEVVSVKIDRDSQSQVLVLKVKLKFTNTGEKPVILLLGAYGESKHWWVLNRLFHAR
jgi:hypothetical protein